MKLQKATMCGLYAVLELAAHPERQISAAEIANKYDISINHLAKVLRSLVRAKLVESVRGAGGGYRFSGNPKRATLYDIIELFEEIGRDAVEQSSLDHDESRALHTVLHEIDENAVMTLRSISITTLIKIMEKQRRRANKEARGPVRAGVLAGG
ncbi:MAG: Rrf2 family transcriptional regulator [Xanthobacteraceae bacterium]|nr:MAG: Rrf2 family transcriptional regulator [Xanthobacteraceae bacterium]